MFLKVLFLSGYLYWNQSIVCATEVSEFAMIVKLWHSLSYNGGNSATYDLHEILREWWMYNAEW